MKTPVKMLSIYVDETDLWHGLPLYEAIVRRLRQADIAGATAQLGMMGYGSHRKVHRRRLFGISDDKPVIISAVDEEASLRAILPEIRAMVKEGLLVLSDVEVIEPGQAHELSS
jgi:PII-like signaling protein